LPEKMRWFCLLIFLTTIGCTPSKVEPPEVQRGPVWVCQHKYEPAFRYIVADQTNIEKLIIEECPPVLIDATGQCPIYIRFDDIVLGEVLLTEKEWQNYDCEQKESLRDEIE